MLLSQFIQRNPKPNRPHVSHTKAAPLNLVSFSLALSGVLAASIAIGVIEFGRGVGTTDSCIDSLRISFSHSTPENGNTIVTGFTLSGVNDNCSGQWLMVRLVGSSGQALDEIVWQVTPGTTTLSTTANEITADLASTTVVGVEYLLSDEQLFPAN